MSRLFWLLILLLSIGAFSAGCDSGDSVDGDSEQELELLPDGDPDLEAETTVDGDDDLTDIEADENEDGDADIETGEEDLEDETEVADVAACVGEIEQRQLDLSEDYTFDLGPYLMYPREDAIVIMWRTLLAKDGKVLYGIGDNLDNEVSQEGESEIHEIELTGLEPNTRYSYKVQSGVTTSESHHFYTAPKSNQGSRVAIWGDNHSGTSFPFILDSIAGFKPHFLLGVGDHVNDGSNANEWKDYLFNPARKLMHELPFYAAVGNHARDGETLYKLYHFPYDSEDPKHESIYSFSYGNAFFLVVNTNKAFFTIGTYETEYSQFIKDAMASPEAQAATWRIALAHEPGYSEGWGDGQCYDNGDDRHYDGYQPLRGWLFPLLKEHNFHFYFNGHMHGYERGTDGSLVYVTTGGGGGWLDAQCFDFESTTVAHYAFNHLILDLGCDQAKVGAWDLEGQQFDWVLLEADKYGQVVDQGPMENLPPPTINSDSKLEDGDVDEEALEADEEGRKL